MAELGFGKELAVKVTLSGYSCPSTAVVGGKYMIPLSKARRIAKIVAGLGGL